MSTRTERTAQIVATVAAALSIDPALTGVVVTDDAAKLDKKGPGQHGTVLVQPTPRFEFPVGGVTRLSWTLFVVAKPGPALDAFATVDPILDALIASPLSLDSAEPGEYQPADDMSPPFPGYLVTIRDDFYN